MISLRGLIIIPINFSNQTQTTVRLYFINDCLVCKMFRNKSAEFPHWWITFQTFQTKNLGHVFDIFSQLWYQGTRSNP